MTTAEFHKTVSDGPQSTIVDVWAPWCGPCKAMHPVIEKLSDEFGDQVRVLSLNADENPEVVNDLKVFAIPTLIGFTPEGTEIARRTGAQHEGALRELFAAMAEGRAVPGVSNRSRIFRLLAAFAVAITGTFVPVSWPFYTVAAGLFAFAIHDRCPIIGAIKRLVRPGTRSSAGTTIHADS